MVLEKLIERIMRAAIQHAGAERGLLILHIGDELQIKAEATILGNDVTVHLRDTSETAAVFPESVVRYVARTRKDVILGDATSGNPFSGDPYIARRRARSIVCLPLVNQGRLNGVIYLDNNLTAHVFTSDRITLLKVLASQAAISLENTRLYGDLENREAKIRRLVDANILGITTWNVEGAILASNEAFLRMVQYDHDDVAAGRVRWRDMTPADWRERVERALAKVMQTGSVQPFESELFRKDGSRLPVLLAGALFEEGGNEGVAFALDLSEQKRADEALRRSESYLAQAQRLAHVGSWAWAAPARNALYISEEWYRIFGFDPKDGMPTWEQRSQRVYSEDRARWQATIDRAIAEKSDYEMEFRILPPHSTIKYIHSVGHPVLDSSGELLQFVGVSMDVTERKRAEEALRSSEAYLAESQRLTRTGSWASHGTTHEARYWSEEMFRVFGFDPQQGFPMRAQWLQRIHPEDRDRVKREASDRMFVQKVDSDIEYRIVLPDGTIKHIHGLAHPVFSSDGELVEVVGTVVDITERKRAENERERLQQLQADLAHINRVSMMGELTASLAHEIKQPIFAASADAETCLRWLERDQPDLAEAQEAALRLMKDVSRASDIINRIVSLFKKEVPLRELVDVKGVIQEMTTLLRGEASRYSISIHEELMEGLPKIEADRVALQQVLMNLMLNAIEAMKDMATPGKLTITTQRDENRQILVSVSDTGMGLPPEQTEQIFNTFFTSKSQGTGMGLPISRSIIESHGGRLWATSNSGPGATFRFILPVEAAAAQSA
jgi:PAS domain S-box-containing protein